MKTLKNFDGFVLSAEEMMTVRGGEGEIIVEPTRPPIRI
jgi:hypothetical protein